MPRKKAAPQASILRRIWREHTRRYAWVLAGVVVLTALIAAMEGYAVSLLKPVFDEGFVGGDGRVLRALCAQVAALYFAKGWLYYVQALTMSRISARTIQSVQSRVFSRLVSLDMEFFNRNSSGQMLSRLIGDTTAITNIAVNFITTIFRDMITCIAMFSLMIYYSWRILLVVIVFLPVGALLIRRVRRRAREITKSSTQASADFVSRLSESLQNMKVIKSYCMEGYERGYIGQLLESLYRLNMKNVRNSAFATPIIESLSGLMLAGIIIFGGWQVSIGALTAGGFITFLGAWVSVYKPLKSLAGFNVQLQQALVSAERVYEVIDTKPRVRDAGNAVALEHVRGDIEFRNVDFAYEKGRPILRGVNIRVPHGRTIALVGPSGGGKTTIVNLIPRFFDPTAGKIAVDGVDIRKIAQKSLRGQTALVSQDVMLFDDTIGKNIAYGRGEGAAVSGADIVAAAKLANAHGFISAMRRGYDTMVGERGVKLSGGQKQRISIARAIIKDAPILLLDEATSALDTESEREVQKALDSLMKGRTTIVIAHRLSTIVNADRIYVIDKGRVVEEGSHAELLKKGGEYARLYGIQFGGK